MADSDGSPPNSPEPDKSSGSVSPKASKSSTPRGTPPPRETPTPTRQLTGGTPLGSRPSSGAPRRRSSGSGTEMRVETDMRRDSVGSSARVKIRTTSSRRQSNMSTMARLHIETAESESEVLQSKLLADLEKRAQAAAERAEREAAYMKASPTGSESATVNDSHSIMQQMELEHQKRVKLSNEEAIAKARLRLNTIMEVNRKLHGAIIEKRAQSHKIELELERLDELLWFKRDILEQARQDATDELEDATNATQQSMQAANLELGNSIIEEEERLSFMEQQNLKLKDLGLEYRSLLKEQELEIATKRKSIRQLQRHVEIIAEGGVEQVSTAQVEEYDEYGMNLNDIEEDENAAMEDAAQLDKHIGETLNLKPASPASPASAGSPASPAGGLTPRMPSLRKRTDTAAPADANERRNRYQDLPGLDLAKMLFDRPPGAKGK
eukprot:TRINITY_DN9508_c0_g1_i1.p1 TRINITY_DN9508_c0_g1~~TRINITY_DN9508_c0_g1_i1.p1  ORF type:complete len:439 (-),score=123.58 TRINITY_DN9508_c0_g1_i1:94-1410(-)